MISLVKPVTHVLFCMVLGLLFANCGDVDDKSQMKITNIWSRPAKVNGVVYMHIENKGDDDRLLGASSDIAEFLEIHETVIQDGNMKMHHLHNGLKIPPYGKVDLKPKGLHIMLINLSRELERGDSFTLTLEFEKSGQITITSQIAAKGPDS